METSLSLMSKLIIWLIHIYQIVISPILSHRCRFSITCSQYGINSIRKFGILKGSYKTCIRILKCHPLNINNNKNKKSSIFKHIKIQDIVNMSSQRNFFIIAFFITSFILWQLWNIEHNHKQSDFNNIKNNHQHSNLNTTNSNSIGINTCKNNTDPDYNIITIKTNVFLIKINKYGGNIEEIYLTNYYDNLHSKQPLNLLSTSSKYKNQAHTKLTYDIHPENNINNNIVPLYIDPNNQNEYILKDHTNMLQLNLIYCDYKKEDVIYTKRYTFNKNDYSIYIDYIVDNKSKHPLNIKLLGNLIQFIPPSAQSNKNNKNNISFYSYQEAAYSTDKKKYQKYNIKDIKQMYLNINSIGGWIALLQKYFVIAWLPIIPKNNTFYNTYLNENNIIVGFQSNHIYIPINQKIKLQSILWIGPKIQDQLKLVDPNLELVIDYGWLWFISQPLFKLLQFIHNYINNWGISIIIITIIIRLIMYPLTKAQYTSMAKIRTLQPKLIAIQNEYKHDKYQYHQKTLELYKKEKVNPLGGCFPLLIQMPIFLALYYMLSDSIELRHSKFTLWINDLSAQDPYYILPIIMGITMFLIQKLSPTTISDPIQKKIMTIMLFIFTIFFLWFPSGLVLYYIVSNIITIIQQQMIYHGLSKKGLHNKNI